MRTRFWTLMLILCLASGCKAERQAVKTYLDQAATEVPVLQQIGQDTQDAFDDLRFAPRPKDLGVLRQRLQSTRVDLQKQVGELQQSRARVAALQAPLAAAELEAKLLESYDGWIGCGRRLVELCAQAETALADLEQGPAEGKGQRFGLAAEELGDGLRGLGRLARDAERSTKAAGRELKRLHQTHGVAIQVPAPDWGGSDGL